jgi:hypothetical protein
MDKMGMVAWRPPRQLSPAEMRAMFACWVLLIGAGLVYFSVIGLTHH